MCRSTASSSLVYSSSFHSAPLLSLSAQGPPPVPTYWCLESLQEPRLCTLRLLVFVAMEWFSCHHKDIVLLERDWDWVPWKEGAKMGRSFCSCAGKENSKRSSAQPSRYSWAVP